MVTADVRDGSEVDADGVVVGVVLVEVVESSNSR